MKIYSVWDCRFGEKSNLVQYTGYILPERFHSLKVCLVGGIKVGKIFDLTFILANESFSEYEMKESGKPSQKALNARKWSRIR